MAIETYRRTVTTAATLLYAHPKTSSSSEGDFPNKNVSLINVSTTQAQVVVGPQGVTTANGARWTVEAGRVLSVVIEPTESIYAIVASGTQDIDVIANGR